MRNISSVVTSLAVTALLLFSGTAVASDIAGSYLLDDGENHIALTLKNTEDGSISGAMNDNGDLFQVVARLIEESVAGAIIDERTDEQYPMLAKLSDDGRVLYVRIYSGVDDNGDIVEESGQTIAFQRNEDTDPK